MLKTPPRGSVSFRASAYARAANEDAVPILERPMRMPFRYSSMVCSGTLTRTMKGPLGESSGCHQYSPGLSVSVGLPVGVPLVWKEGCCTAYDEVRSAIKSVTVDRIFIK